MARERLYLCGDSETGGLDNSYSLLTAGFILTDEDKTEIARKYIKFKREKYIVSVGAMRVNKLSLEDLYANGLTREQAEQEVFDLIRPYTDKKAYEIILVCHNIPFDTSFLYVEFPWLKDCLSYRTLDTVGIALSLVDAGLLDVDNVKLETLTAHFGISHEAHNAIYDAEAMLNVWKRMIKVMQRGNKTKSKV